MVFFEWRDRLDRYFAFSRKEVRDLGIAIIIVGFIFSFRDWGSGSAFDALLGVKNLVVTVIVAAISFFVHEAAHRIMALSQGFKAEFRIWWGGLLASLILVFASNGRIQLVLPGGMVMALIARQRLGEFRYGWNYWENGIVAMWGPVASIALAFFAKLLVDVFPSSFFFQKLFIVNILFAICTMLPLPHLDGLSTFFGGRMLYIIVYTAIIVASILLLLPKVLSILGALVVGLIIAGIIIFLYFIIIEKKVE